MNAYPFIISANLTKNSYETIGQNIGLPHRLDGNYDSIVEPSLRKRHPLYAGDINQKFSKEYICQYFINGGREIYMEFQGLGADEMYHWVSLLAINVENLYSQDILVIELLKVMDNQRSEQAQILRDSSQWK